MYTIAIAGLSHETNTFAATPTAFEDFVRRDSMPPLTEGERILEDFAGSNVPVGGFIAAANELGLTLLPLIWACAQPSGMVAEAAYERIAGAIVQGVADRLDEIDGVYLDLHGAMVPEHLEDGEGELLRRLRELVGPQIPLVASLDLHANVTDAMVEHASALIAYRTYPHVDAAETGARACRHIADLLEGVRGEQRKELRRLPFLLPLSAQCTLMEPAASIFQALAEIEGNGLEEGVSTCSFTPGFPGADIAECGPAVIVYGDTRGIAAEAADLLARRIAEREGDFRIEMLPPDRAVARAMAAPAGGPVVLADVQDNSGAGATSDTTGLLRALLQAGAVDTLAGLYFDPEAAAAAHAAGEGAEIAIALGGKRFPAGGPPLDGLFTVERLSQGVFDCNGPFYRGITANLGPTALLRIGGVRLVVGSQRMQAADQQIFRHLGAEPAAQRILALKSTVHFRADFGPIAQEVIVVEAPGAFIDRPERLPYRRLRPGIRLGPLGPVHQPVTA